MGRCRKHRSPTRKPRSSSRSCRCRVQRSAAAPRRWGRSRWASGPKHKRSCQPIGAAMPYDSNAQRKYFHAALARGEIKPSVVHEFDQASKGLKLPEHVKKMAQGGEVEAPEIGRHLEDYCPACG